MKEYTFLEAVEILEKGECEKIMPAIWANGFGGYIVRGGVLSFTTPSFTNGITLEPKLFLGGWKCIGMKPRTKEELEKDIITLVLRLKGESTYTFAPEAAEVMVRWLPKANEVLRNACLPED